MNPTPLHGSFDPPQGSRCNSPGVGPDSPSPGNARMALDSDRHLDFKRNLGEKKKRGARFGLKGGLSKGI